MKNVFVIVIVCFSSMLHAQSNWNMYNQNGYSIELPDYILQVSSQNSIDVFANSNNKDIYISIESAPSDKMNFNSKYISEIANSGITYKLIKDSVYTVSYTDNNTINYHKSFISNGSVHSLIILYPNKQKSQFDLVLQRIGRSFK